MEQSEDDLQMLEHLVGLRHCTDCFQLPGANQPWKCGSVRKRKKLCCPFT